MSILKINTRNFLVSERLIYYMRLRQAQPDTQFLHVQHDVIIGLSKDNIEAAGLRLKVIYITREKSMGHGRKAGRRWSE